MENKQLKVYREAYQKNGKEYYSYYIAGTSKGKTAKVQIVPPDIGGYAVLDIVFDGVEEAELVVTPYKMQAENGGTIEGNTYSVVSYDADGEMYECPVKPANKSMKALLKMVLK